MKREDILELIDSWENLAYMINEIGRHPEYFEILMEIVLNSTDKKSWRAAYLADKIHDLYPGLLLPYLEPMIIKLQTLKDLGKKRHFLKLISAHDIPEQHLSFLFDFCLKTLSSEEPPAVRVHAMQVLFNISEKEKDFKPELILLIEQEIEFRSTAGIITRGTKLVKKLRKQVL
jgi:hypothetical protein